MIIALTTLLLLQLIGEVAVTSLDLPLPGPVLGMLLLFAGLLLRRGLPEALSQVSGTLLGNLSLLFIPAGVGVMVHIERLAEHGLAVAVALVVSTLLALVLTRCA